jgi:outer membrane protein TolC
MGRAALAVIGIGVGAAVAGCSSLAVNPAQGDALAGGASGGPKPGRVRETRVAAAVDVAAEPPAFAPTNVGGPPYQLDIPTIVTLVYERNRRVAAERADMIAADYALKEFRANLSRFEPFTEVRSDLSDFPNRQDTQTVAGEAVAGLQKETFEGAILRIEGGGSASRSKVGEPEDEDDATEQGAGGLIRGRIEVPFVGSRRRQERIINQAFQESSARKARLAYLQYYRTSVLNALSYYAQSVLYTEDAASYDRHVADLRVLLEDPRVMAEDRSRLETVVSDFESRAALQRSYRQVYLRYLLATTGLDQKEEVELVMPEYAPSPFVERAEEEGGVDSMIEEARQNNPTFRVLSDAIEDAELQRQLAIQGEFDITAFVEGTHFPLGAKTFDDRYDGWQLGGGVSVSLNDQRVLRASRLKAEAEIRSYQARMEAELQEVQRQVVTETEALRDEREQREQLLRLIEQKEDEYESRREAYLTAKRVLIDQVLDSRTELTNAEIQLNRLLYRRLSRVIRLEAALGFYYRMAGLNVDETTDRSD